MTRISESEKLIALAAVREAARLCDTVQREMGAGQIEKSDRSPVTIADFGSQALICSRLKAAYPDDPIVAEESSAALRGPEEAHVAKQVIRAVQALRPDAAGDDILDWIDLGTHKEQAPRFWTLDPIDGTKGFLRRDQYAVALALIVDGEVVLAVLGCPNLSLSSHPDVKGILAVAVKGQGTQLVRLSDMSILSDARVTDISDPIDARFSESVESAHTSHAQSAVISRLLGITKPATRLDSQAKYVVVAAGDADVYLRLPSKRRYVENIWDHAAGMLIVTEAGGRVTDIHGRDLDFRYGAGLKNNLGVLVSNGHLHGNILQAIKATEANDQD